MVRLVDPGSGGRQWWWWWCQGRRDTGVRRMRKMRIRKRIGRSVGRVGLEVWVGPGCVAGVGCGMWVSPAPPSLQATHTGPSGAASCRGRQKVRVNEFQESDRCGKGRKSLNDAEDLLQFDHTDSTI